MFDVRALRNRAPALGPKRMFVDRSSTGGVFKTRGSVKGALCFDHTSDSASTVRCSAVDTIVESFPSKAQRGDSFCFLRATNVRPGHGCQSLIILLSGNISDGRVGRELHRRVPTFKGGGSRCLATHAFGRRVCGPSGLDTAFFVPLVNLLVLVTTVVGFLGFYVRSFCGQAQRLDLQGYLNSSTGKLFELLFDRVTILFVLSTLTDLILAR